MQFILICGHNQGSGARAAKPQRLPYPKFVEGFTTEVPYYMQLSDFFIGKPGPGRISEALAMRLPVIVERNAWTLPQERYNADWVRETGTGMVVHSFREIDEAVDNFWSRRRWPATGRTPPRLHNRAVFEIPEILEQILPRRVASSAPAREARGPGSRRGSAPPRRSAAADGRSPWTRTAQTGFSAGSASSSSEPSSAGKRPHSARQADVGQPDLEDAQVADHQRSWTRDRDGSALGRQSRQASRLPAATVAMP